MGWSGLVGRIPGVTACQGRRIERKGPDALIRAKANDALYYRTTLAEIVEACPLIVLVARFSSRAPRNVYTQQQPNNNITLVQYITRFI